VHEQIQRAKYEKKHSYSQQSANNRKKKFRKNVKEIDIRIQKHGQRSGQQKQSVTKKKKKKKKKMMMMKKKKIMKMTYRLLRSSVDFRNARL